MHQLLRFCLQHPSPGGERDPLLGFGADHHRLDERLRHRLIRLPSDDEFGTGSPAFVRLWHHIALGGQGLESQGIGLIVLQKLAFRVVVIH